MEVDFKRLELILSYEFQNRELLLEALCHSSYTYEHPGKKLKHNERLEFLGDAVINLVVGHVLMERFPDLKEGDLHRMRSGLVNESQLAQFADSLDLRSFLLLGKGELRTQGREKPSILANTLEAVIAAIYLDGGLDSAYRVIQTYFEPLLDLMVSSPSLNDYKSQLQEFIQSARQKMPIYTVLSENGPDHNKTFCIEVQVLGISAQGSGKSKKIAELEAAKNALSMLKPNFKSNLNGIGKQGNAGQEF